MMEHNDEAASKLSETHLQEAKTAPKNVYNSPIKRPFKTTLYDIQHKKYLNTGKRAQRSHIAIP